MQPARASTFGCRLCPLLVQSRKWIVDGNGNPRARLVFIGEAPGKEEDRLGVPFIGQSGKLLKDTLYKAGLLDTQMFLTNVVRCHPEDNRDPTDLEVSNCSGWLMAELQMLTEARAVVLMGKVSLKVRAVVEAVLPGAKVFEAYHPAYVLRMPRFRQAWEDQIAGIVEYANAGVVYVSPGVEPWMEGMPDVTSAWLSVDIETDSGEEKTGVTRVAWTMSDGVESYFHDGPEHPSMFYAGRQQPTWYWNAKYDVPDVGGNLRDLDSWEDGMLVSYVLRYPMVGLKPMTEYLSGWKLGKYTDLVGTGKKQVSFSEALKRDRRAAIKYASEDTVATSRNAMQLWPELMKRPRLLKYYREIEKPIVPVLRDMEDAGVRINEAKIRELDAELETVIREREQKIRDFWGQEDDWKHTKKSDLVPVLESAGADLKWRTPTGQVQLDEQVLLRLAGAHVAEDIVPDTLLRELVQDILWCREHAKLRSTYTSPIARGLDREGRLHARFNQCVAETNRLSSDGPNLQNIPIRGRIGNRIREMFEADYSRGLRLVKADYSQLEVRIYAEQTGEQYLVEAYTHRSHNSDGKSGACTRCDVHQIVADLLRIPRWRAKNVLFAAIYGADAPKLAETAGVSESETADFLDRMRRLLPSLLTWQSRVLREHDSCGYVETMLGWRNSYPLLASPFRREQKEALRKAANFPIQGTASGLVKRAMIMLDREASRYEARLVLQVHDEVVYEVPAGNVARWARVVEEVGRRAGDGIMQTVPIQFELASGLNWGAVEKLAHAA